MHHIPFSDSDHARKPQQSSMNDDAPRDIICLVEGESSPFIVTLTGSQSIMKLKKLIKDERKNGVLNSVDATDLTLWKVDLSRPGKEERKNLIGKDVLESEELDEFEVISNYWPMTRLPIPGHLHIIVELPSARSIPRMADMVPTLANRAEFTMKVRSRDRWDRLCKDDLYPNKVEQTESSQFLDDFQGRLGRKRYVYRGTEELYAKFQEIFESCSTIRQSLHPYLDIDATHSAESDIPELDRVTVAELFHYCGVLGNQQLKNREHYEENKESQVRSFLMEFLKVGSFPEVKCAFQKSLPFPLVIEASKTFYSYTPRNDFHMSIRDFPHILLEVNSQRNEGDEYRMLLQAACLCRIGNWLRGPSNGDPIVIMAVYIDKFFSARQHILCQPNVRSTRVEYVTEIFDLREARTAFEFIFQMYNFFTDAMDGDSRLHEPQRRLADAKQEVAQKQYKTWTGSKRKYDEAQRNSKKSKRNPDTSVQGGEEDCLDNPSVMREVARAGYTPAQPISEEVTLMTPLKPTMCQATSRSGVLVVLKTIVGSNELRFLHHLSGIKESSNHTIPLLDVINLSIEKMIIVLPWMSPLHEVLQFGDRHDDVVSLCLQFIEGVAFLHRHNVAHCDLKPDNVVVDMKPESQVSPQLFIIDFDLALYVESKETMAEGWCGTPPWIAPELGSGNGPIQWYSPILADRWACGRMIEYFANYFPIYEGAQKTRLRAFAQRLLNVDPRARPELNQLQAIHERQKRKAANSRHESVPKRYAVNGHDKENLSLFEFEFPEARMQQASVALDNAAEMRTVKMVA